MTRRKTLLWLIPAFLLGVVLWRIAPSGDDKKHASPAVSVQTARAVRQNVPILAREVGTVVAYETVAVRSRLDSQVMEVHFKDGDTVKKGDVLFVLDDRALSAQMHEQEANLARDKAQLENAKLQWERAQKLLKSGFVAKANLDTAKAAFETAKAAVSATEAAIANLRVQLEYTRITAPIDGRTGTIAVTQGNTVKANDTTPLVTINQVQPIRVQFALPQRYLDRVATALKSGAVTVKATREGSATAATGVLEYIDNNVNTGSGTFGARALFQNTDTALWPGMFVTLQIELGVEANALTVPEQAVQQGQNGQYVFVIVGDKAVKRDVTISRTEGGNAVITGGVKDNESVAIDGLAQLTDGATVKVATQKKP